MPTWAPRCRTTPEFATLKSSALGVAENDIAAAGIGQHRHTDIAGVGAALLPMAVLCADAHRAVGDSLSNGQQQRCRRTDDDVATALRSNGAARKPGDFRRQGNAVGAAAVHLPIAGDQRPGRGL